LQQLFGRQAAIVPLLAWGDQAVAEQLLQRRRWKLELYDGRTAAQHYAVTTVPRFLLLDRQGIVRWSFTGVGPEVGFLVREQLQRLLTSPHGTVSPDSPDNKTPTSHRPIPP
jgi:hypothetical protein